MIDLKFQIKILFLLFPLLGHGYTIRSDSEISSGYVSQHFQVRGEGFPSESYHFASWSLGVGGARSQIENTSGEVTESNSRDFSVGADFGYSKSWFLALSADSNKAFETEYTHSTAGIQLSYTHPYKNDQSWSAGIGASQGSIKQHLSAQILNTRFGRDVNLDQNESHFFIGWSPMAELFMQIRTSFFSYSRSKQELNAAFQSPFLNTFTSELVSSIGGLPESQLQARVTYQLDPDWDLSFNTSQTKHIVDDSLSRRSEITGTYYVKAWLFEAGLGRSQSENLSELSGIFGFGYSWD
ncbi:MAG: hypothetical protein ACXWC9_09185 [Pseudobdellovibrionaceae bacterium]